MPPALESLIAGLPVFMAHSGATLGVLFVGVLLYVKMTAHDEMALIRENNHAAALSLGGAIVGIALPLAASLTASVSVLDIVIWGAVAVVLQLVAFRIVDLALKDISERIEAGEMGAAIFLVSVKLGTAFVNAAALSG